MKRVKRCNAASNRSPLQRPKVLTGTSSDLLPFFERYVKHGNSVDFNEHLSNQVRDNGRFLVKADGQPFLWFADTAWELFHRLDREDADHIFKGGPNRNSHLFRLLSSENLMEPGTERLWRSSPSGCRSDASKRALFPTCGLDLRRKPPWSDARYFANMGR